MTSFVITQLLQLLLKFLTPELIRTGLDALFDAIEQAVKNSPNTVDNTIVLPLIGILRLALSVPDQPMGARGLDALGAENELMGRAMGRGPGGAQ